MSADSGKSVHTETVEKLSYKDAASNLSNIGTALQTAKTQSRLRQKTLTEITDQGKKIPTLKKTETKQGDASKSNDKQAKKKTHQRKKNCQSSSKVLLKK